MAVTSATERLRRLLVLVPWVADHPDGVAIDEVCRRFDCSPSRLLSDLDTVMMVGVYPFTPDTLIDVEVADGRVTIRYADSFTRPFRLTPGEAVALVAAARAVLAAPDAEQFGPLARAVDKLTAVLGPDRTPAVDVRLGPAQADVFALLQRAVGDRHQIEIDYFQPDRGARERRSIEPAQLWSSDGHWYISGWCHRAEGVRVFRVDRIAEASATDRPFDHPSDAAPSIVAFDGGLPRVVLDVRRTALWRFESVPVIERTDGANGSVRLTIAVSSLTWLARTLVQLGPEVDLVDADTRLDIDDLVPNEAARLLARYR